MDGKQLLGIEPPTVQPPVAQKVRAVRDEIPTLPFPEKFVGSFNDDGSIRLTTERLAFEVKTAETQDDLFKAVAIRYQAYSRHLPELARRLVAPEPADTAPGYTVLVAENRLDGAPLATVRLQTNEFGPLALEQSVVLPDWLQGRRLAEATRLAVADGVRGRFVTLVMFKAFFQFCLEQDVEWMVVCARPPLDRIYLSLLFEDVAADGAYLPLKHAANIPHRALAFHVRTAEPRWRTVGHSLYGFMGLTIHPDIRVGLPGPSAVPNTAYYRDRAAA
ncbi:MAG: N-acyl amino acid synthase FeeM domain-containing protein [Burkholderiaceae bacterium]